MNSKAGQQRLTAFYEATKETGKSEEKMKKPTTMKEPEDEKISDDDGDTIMKDVKTQKKEEELEVESKDEITTSKREGEEKASPRRKQQKKKKENTKYGEYGKEKRNNTPSKSNKNNKKEEDEEETTPERNNHTMYNHVHVTRITLKLTVQSQKDMKMGMIKMFKEYLTEIRKADPNVQVYPWKEGQDKTKPRIKSENELTDIPAMQAAYGKGFFVYKGQGTMRLYPKIRIGHDCSIEDMREETNEWARANECNIFRDRLQFEKTTQVGWFCYSTRNFDTEALSEVISNSMGFKVDLQWRMVATGKKGKVSEEQKT